MADFSNSSSMDWSIEDSDALMALTGSTGLQNAQRSEAMEVDEKEPKQCPHLVSALKVEATRVSILKKYKNAVAWGAQSSNSPGGSRPAKRRKLGIPTCGRCGISLIRPFICLHCAYGACWQGDHILSHLQDLKHPLCLDVKSGAVFCAVCEEFIYDQTLEDLYRSTRLTVEVKETRFTQARKSREPYQAWSPDSRDQALLNNTVPLTNAGQRGLLNLGQTCFLNSVLQCLLHNPMLRNYFLSDKHNSKLCNKASEECMCCELDKLFAEVFSGERAPYAPASFLAATWRSSKELAGYAQQDAHECFFSVLNQIHASSRGSTNVSCNCVVHTVFSGALQSDIKCDKCGKLTSTPDPILDVSLELKAEDGTEDTLAGCLRRYTRSEKLASKYTCSHCNNSSQAYKRLTIKKLPPVLSFQFKRFEKDKAGAPARKIETPVRFPASISMAPFTTLAAGMHNKENEKDPNRLPEGMGPDILYEYDLFAIINHEGKIDNGHYIAFARSHDGWYRYDDDKITRTTIEAALKTTTYMCFYVKRHLEYKPFMRPSYVVTRETEAVKEKQKEKEKEAARMKEVEDALLATV